MSYFPKPHTNRNITEVELDLCNHATKSDLKKRNRCQYIAIC